MHICCRPLQVSWMSPEEAAAQSNAAVTRFADEKMSDEAAKLLKRQLGESWLVFDGLFCSFRACSAAFVQIKLVQQAAKLLKRQLGESWLAASVGHHMGCSLPAAGHVCF